MSGDLSDALNRHAQAALTALMPKPVDLSGSNYQSTGTQTFRKSNINARVDHHLRQNDFLYVTGGYTRGDISFG